MSRLQIQWNDRSFMVAVEDASEAALDTAADHLRGEVVKGIRKKTTGMVTGRLRGRNVYKGSLPGTPPGVRTGTLWRSIAWDRPGKLRRRVGTNVEYARIHELGGSIKHPGGTPFMFIGGRFQPIRETTAVGRELQGQFVGYTKPFRIDMPKRPFLVPALNASFGSGRVQAKFNRKFQQVMRQRGKLAAQYGGTE